LAYVNNGDESWPFLAAEAGYDVWFGNFRGNRYSKKHESLSSDESAFWDFDISDHALKDLPAMISYVYHYTGD
jgi:lysosomal acid lipase/cholesteryl ester hydrolase